MRARTLRRLLGRVLFGLVLLEVLGRAAGFGDPPMAMRDVQTQYHLIASRSYARFGNDIRINRYAMRSDDFDRTRVSATDQLSIFGDSVVYGNHDIDQAQTVARRLQVRLHGLAGHSALTVNAIAASSWGPENLLGYLAKFGEFPAQAGVLVLSSHDLVDVPDAANDVIPYRIEPTYGAIHDIALSGIEHAWSASHRDKSSLSYAQKLVRTAQAIDRLILQLRSHHRTLVLVFHPTRDELHAAGRPDAERTLSLIAARHAIAFLSLVDTYRAAEQQGVDVYQDAIHLAPHGAVVLANRLFDAVVADYR